MRGVLLTGRPKPTGVGCHGCIAPIPYTIPTDADAPF